jgi:hypothetical protein
VDKIGAEDLFEKFSAEMEFCKIDPRKRKNISATVIWPLVLVIDTCCRFELRALTSSLDSFWNCSSFSTLMAFCSE